MDLLTKIFLINLIMFIFTAALDKYCFDDAIAILAEKSKTACWFIKAWVLISLFSIPLHICLLVALF